MLKQKSTIDTTKIKDELSKILNMEIWQIASEFQHVRYSDIYKIKVNNAYSFILKDISNTWLDFELYKYILEPYKLDSPKIYGELEIGHNAFIIMEYIPHEPTDWRSEEKYKRAIDWLIKKDSILSENLNKIASFPYIQPFNKTLVTWLEKIQKGVETKTHPSLTYQFFTDIKNEFHEVISLLKEGKQTICHNDFQMQNVLFGTGERAGEIYVVDWTLPSIGSVCVDLATLVHYAPDDIKPDLLERYRSRMDFNGFEEVFKGAQVYANLFDFSWMVTALIDGKKETINTDRFNYLLRELQRINLS
jgi:thiamine kinase-like enzyme